MALANFTHSTLSHPLAAAALAVGLSGVAAHADIVHGDDVVIPEGNLCVGYGCFDGEVFGTDTIRMKKDVVRLHFWDTSVAKPTTDWRLIANDDFQGGAEYFAIDEGEETRHIFYIEAGSRPNSIYVSRNGSVGFGTTAPVNGLYYQSGSLPTLTLDQDGSGGYPPQTWSLAGSHDDFALRDVTAGHSYVMRVSTGAPSHSLVLDATGEMGLGTASPLAGLHLARNDGKARVLVEESNASTSPRDLMTLYNNGRPEIVMGNTSTGNEWSVGAGTNLVMKTGALNSPSSAKTKHLTLFGATGNLKISGQIITGGPTCSGGCDAVFGADYNLASIEQHARAMYTLGHLPAIGATRPGAVVNMSEQYGAMLNELEHAHIYIAELERDVSRIPALEARLSALEAGLAKD